MLDNSITLSVDTANTGSTTDLTYSRFEELTNRSSYISENHEPGARDTLAFYRTLPKPAGTFKGVRKTSVKFTRDFTVADSAGGTVDSPAIVEVNFSLPIGLTSAQIVEVRQRVLALLDTDTVMDKLNVLQMV